jgi:CBS domain-containing membrane protein
MAGTAGAMILFRVTHPPGGATALIVSLGLITAPWHLFTIELAVALLTLEAFLFNRLAGLDYPFWSRRGQQGQGREQPSARVRPPLGPSRRIRSTF